LFKEASRRKGITGEILLQLCEARLDNVVYRLGIAPTRRAARQLVTHKHITVNGNNVNIPSYALQVGDIVSVRERSKSLEAISNSMIANPSQMEWLEFNSETKLGKVIASPERIQIPGNIKEQLIVELYSK
jgi:small subunit ribosomal protein S4